MVAVEVRNLPRRIVVVEVKRLPDQVLLSKVRYFLKGVSWCVNIPHSVMNSAYPDYIYNVSSLAYVLH